MKWWQAVLIGIAIGLLIGFSFIIWMGLTGRLSIQ